MKLILLSALGRHCQVAHDKVADFLHTATTAYSYGHSVRDILDRHGSAIRNAGTPLQIEEAAAHCDCCTRFPGFIDTAVNHVRTLSPLILPVPFREMAVFGLNYRPRIGKSASLLADELELWARSVLAKARLDPDLIEPTISCFRRRVFESSEFLPVRGLNEYRLCQSAGKLCKHLVITGVDKASNTASYECINFYRLMCLHRLRSDAFDPVDAEAALLFNYQLVEYWTPWAIESDFRPAILFAMPKILKRHKDILAYRWITSGCSEHLKPLSDELVRVLTPLWQKAREHCITLSRQTGAKYWWTTESLDLVSHNIDTAATRPDRKPSAFDLEKCYESIPLTDGEHSLMTRIALFLDLVFQDGLAFCANLDYRGLPGNYKFTLSSQADRFDVSYTKTSLLEMIEQTVTSTAIFVGDYCGSQNLGIPMGSSASVILLNIYRFTYEYGFVSRIVLLQPELIDSTWELFAYVDDIGNFSDIELSLYLDPSQPFTDSNPYWIYPLAPAGPLGIKEQVSHLPGGVRDFVYLNQRYIFADGILDYAWFDKSTLLDFNASIYTHWTSRVSYSCKIGIVKSQIRAVILASSSLEYMNHSLDLLRDKFAKIAYPKHVLEPLFDELPAVLLSTLCLTLK
jgi:hypothetical protein